MTLDFAGLIQGSDEWRAARCGWATGSRMGDMTARTKTGWGASRANYMAELLVERLTGVPTNGYASDAMKWGTDTEPEGRMEYQLLTGFDVRQIGFIPHPTIAMAGCSPDGLIGDDGGVEIKCPNSATHIETLLGRPPRVPEKYEKQIQFNMACTNRQWWDYVSYDPRLPEPMRLFRKRVMRDQHQITYLEKCTVEFLSELAAKLAELEEIYNERDAA
jgi:predicted phage-related endonuclease